MDQNSELQELAGSVSSVIYQNEENGYSVLKLLLDNGESATVVGCFPCAAVGESMIVSGSWTTHNNYGRQFKAEFSQRLMPNTVSAIYDYLADGAVKGIGPAMASLIVNEFGEQSLDIIEHEPEKLTRIRGISQNRAKQISKDFSRQAGMRRLMEFVCSFGLRPILAMRIYRYYGDEGLSLLRDNPYLLATEHIGGSFAEADIMAQEIGVDSYSAMRINAAVLFELRHNAGNGHCFIPREKLASVTAQLIGVDPEAADSSIQSLIDDNQLILEEIAGCQACYLPELYQAETGAAERLAAMSRRVYGDQIDLASLIESLELQLQIRYAPLQKQILELALRHQLVVLTGGPGTGKTTSVRAILAMFDRLGMKTLCAAPTGRAAKRMAELTGKDASTVHRLLEAKFSDDGEAVIFSKNADDPLNCDAVILDECSMVDISLMYALLDAMPPEARLVMVGDADQLPSVGPGNVFSAIIRSQVVPLVRLTEIFRQKQDSRIIRNAHMINRGEHPNLSENAGDFFRLKRLQAANSVDTITELISVRLPGKLHIPAEDIQVLSPTRKGELGTVNLNRHLQQVLNPASAEKHEKAFGDLVFREQDRVMQVKNNYDILWRSADGTTSGTGIFNGDIGKVLSIDLATEQMRVDFDGRIADYSFDSLLELEHSWAMTVHKSQGSEFYAVILALSPGSQMLMTRDVLYTAVTRARKLLILVGDDQTAYQMIDNFRQSKRYSALRVRLRRLCGIEA